MVVMLQIGLALVICVIALFLIAHRHSFRGATSRSLFYGSLLTCVLAAGLTLSACQALSPTESQASPTARADKATLTIYSGRSENLIAPLIELFSKSTGISAAVRYGSTAEMAATILEEGKNSPADVFFAQDAGALGAVAKEGRLVELPPDIIDQVDKRFHSLQGNWVGVSGRARTLVYNTNNVTPDELPANVYELTDPKWRGRVGWAPTNGSFQAFVTAMRVLDGDERTRQWLLDMIANDVQVYNNNTSIVSAVGSGEIDLGLVNHYYLYQFLKEQGEGFPAANHFFPEPGAGSIINIAGVGILDTAPQPALAEEFIRYLLSEEAQRYFAEKTFEYPLAAKDIAIHPTLKPLDDIAAPALDLSQLDDLQATLQMLEETGALQ